MSLKPELSPARPGPGLPRHVAIIADGNRRWARARGLPVTEGHEAGADTLRGRVHDAIELGIEQLTLYAFSTENWSRPTEEVEELISMLAQRVAEETRGLHVQGVKLRFIGRRQEVAPRLVERIDWAENLTGLNTRLTLSVAFNYGGRAEILDAASRFDGSTEEEFHQLLYAPDMCDPELIIRTGGEHRLSNFLLWQSAYSELVFRDELWPDFTRESLVGSLRDFGQRQTRSNRRPKESAGCIV
jgi:undecaprenyl diphosphate synthase